MTSNFRNSRCLIASVALFMLLAAVGCKQEEGSGGTTEFNNEVSSANMPDASLVSLSGRDYDVSVTGTDDETVEFPHDTLMFLNDSMFRTANTQLMGFVRSRYLAQMRGDTIGFAARIFHPGKKTFVLWTGFILDNDIEGKSIAERFGQERDEGTRFSGTRIK